MNEVFYCIFLGFFGGLARIMADQEEKDEYIRHLIVSMYCGLIIYYLCKNFGVSQYLEIAAVLLAGYSSKEMLKILSKVFIDKIKKKF